MKTKQLVLSVVGLGCVGLFLTTASLAGGGTDKVEVCHVPPGDPSAAHTITVGVKASESHLANHQGDKLGACPPTCGEGESCDDGDLCTVDICLDTGFCDNSPVDCDDGNQCTDNICDPAIGCVNADLPEGTACDELGNPCSIDQCQDIGVNRFGCRAVANVPTGTACDDGEECTTDDRCVGESSGLRSILCTGFVTDCDCFNYFGSPDVTNPLCDDGNVCTSNDRCSVDPDRICVGDDTCRCPGGCDPDTGECIGACSSDSDCGGGECCDGCCRTSCGPI